MPLGIHTLSPKKKKVGQAANIFSINGHFCGPCDMDVNYMGVQDDPCD